MNEFEIIRHFFDRTPAGENITLGIGDDGAVVSVPSGFELVLAMDTLIKDVHFSESTAAADIGWKALAVNLSDLAAMGAQPCWATLSLTLPGTDDTWLQSFADGFFTIANQYDVTLIGGDLCRGPLSVTVQAHGLVPAGQALTRGGARTGDWIYVTGCLGDAGYALTSAATESPHSSYFRERLDRPQPRVRFGQSLRGIASSAIDLSDGLAGDIRHIMRASGCGAMIDADKLPVSDALQAEVDSHAAQRLALTAGDDYELCFTLSAEAGYGLTQRLATTGARETATVVGVITDGDDLVIRSANNDMELSAYSHFS